MPDSGRNDLGLKNPKDVSRYGVVLRRTGYEDDVAATSRYRTDQRRYHRHLILREPELDEAIAYLLHATAAFAFSMSGAARFMRPLVQRASPDN